MSPAQLTYCFLYTILVTSDAIATDAVFPKATTDCGIACVYTLYVSYAEGETVSYTDFLSKYNIHAKHGVTTEDLAKIFQEQGLHALPVQVNDLNRIRNLHEKYAMIALVNENHFVIVDRISDQEISLTVPPKQKIHSETGRFADHFDGDLLLVSKEEIILDKVSRSWLFPVLLTAGALASIAGIWTWRKSS